MLLLQSNFSGLHIYIYIYIRCSIWIDIVDLLFQTLIFAMKKYQSICSVDYRTKKSTYIHVIVTFFRIKHSSHTNMNKSNVLKNVRFVRMSTLRIQNHDEHNACIPVFPLPCIQLCKPKRVLSVIHSEMQVIRDMLSIDVMHAAALS